MMTGAERTRAIAGLGFGYVGLTTAARSRAARSRVHDSDWGSQLVEIFRELSRFEHSKYAAAAGVLRAAFHNANLAFQHKNDIVAAITMHWSKALQDALNSAPPRKKKNKSRGDQNEAEEDEDDRELGEVVREEARRKKQEERDEKRAQKLRDDRIRAQKKLNFQFSYLFKLAFPTCGAYGLSGKKKTGRKNEKTHPAPASHRDSAEPLRHESEAKVTIYVIQLKRAGAKKGDYCYYVGRTQNLHSRLASHRGKESTLRGAAWTNQMTFVKVVYTREVPVEDSGFEEDKDVLKLMSKFGSDRVRGGSFSAPSLNKAEQATIQKMVWHNKNACFTCGRTGHVAAACPQHRVGVGAGRVGGDVGRGSRASENDRGGPYPSDGQASENGALRLAEANLDDLGDVAILMRRGDVRRAVEVNCRVIDHLQTQRSRDFHRYVQSLGFSGLAPGVEGEGQPGYSCGAIAAQAAALLLNASDNPEISVMDVDLSAIGLPANIDLAYGWLKDRGVEGTKETPYDPKFHQPGKEARQEEGGYCFLTEAEVYDLIFMWAEYPKYSSKQGTKFELPYDRSLNPLPEVHTVPVLGFRDMRTRFHRDFLTVARDRPGSPTTHVYVVNTSNEFPGQHWFTVAVEFIVVSRN